jgi:acetyl-CoA acetyltransferase
MLIPVVGEAIDRSGIGRKEIGFTVSGSCDYLAGAPFAFVMGLDAVGAWPPIRESHVEMDGAWALYEAWVRLQHGDVDSALVYSFGKSSLGDLPIVLSQQLDPYYQAPLWLDAISAAALQARAWLSAGHDEGEMAEVAARSRKAAKDNPNAVVSGDEKADDLLREPFLVTPLRRHDCPPISDGAVAVVLAAGDKAREVCDRPAWIRGIDHRIEAHGLGVRDLTASESTKIAGERAGVNGVDVAELHAPFSHQEPILRDALGLSNGVEVNPSGGALTANVVMGAGLTRIGEAAQRIMDGRAGNAVAHATSGPCLQHNLVCTLSGDAQ